MYCPLRHIIQRGKVFKCQHQTSGPKVHSPVNYLNVLNFGLEGDREPIRASPRGSCDQELSVETQGVDTFRRGAEKGELKWADTKQTATEVPSAGTARAD